MSTSSENPRRNVYRRALVYSLVAAMGLSALVIYGLMNLDYSAKGVVYNALGLNPTVKWVGKDAPPFQLTDLHTGKQISLQQLRGKVVLLDFWASWCPSCLKQLPIIEKLQRDPALKSKLQILSINMKESLSQPALRSFLKERGYTFPVLLGTEALVKRYKIWFFPALVLITPKGKVFSTAAELHHEGKIRQMIKDAINAES